jgi:hypothetical protein
VFLLLKIGRAWGLNTKEIHTFKDKRIQTQYEVKFLQSVFALNDMLPLKACMWLNLYPPNGIEGSNQSISSIWKVKDHGSRDLAWKTQNIFNFEQNNDVRGL